MGRPTDWSPLADSDPFPGDPDAVSSAGEDYEETAALIDDLAAQLRGLAHDDSWIADAADVFHDHATDTADTIVKAKDRYATVGAQLKRWSSVLRQAQRRSATILEEAHAAQEIISSNSESLLTGIDDPTDAQVAAEDRRQARYADACDELANCRTRLDRLRDEVEGDADRIANDIRDAAKDSVKDSRWDRFKGWISDNAGWISAFADIMGWIAAFAGTLALILALTGFLAPLAAVLTAIALVATALSLLANLSLAIAGEGSWWAVAFDVVSLLTFGVGGRLINLAKAGHKLTQTRALKVVADHAAATFRNANRLKLDVAGFAARTGNRLGNFAAQFSGRFGNWLKDVSAIPLRRLNTRMDIAVDDAVRAVREMQIDPRLTESIRYLDRDLAGYAVRARELASSYGHLPGGHTIVDAARLTQIRANLATLAIGTGQATTFTERGIFAQSPITSFSTVTSPISPWW